PLREVHVVDRELGGQHVLEGVGKRTVANVVKKPWGHHEGAVLRGQRKGVAHAACDMAAAETVLNAGMVRAGKDEVREAELPDRIEALELERLEEIEDERVEPYRPVNGVRNRLRFPHAG